MSFQSPVRRPRSRLKGVTLIELLVGFTIAILLTVAAVSFAAHETRLMGISRDRLDLAQSSRAAIDLIAEDLKKAGAGIGYRSDGTFAGLLLDKFTVDGVDFNPDGVTPTPFNPSVGTGPGVSARLTLGEVGFRRTTTGNSYTSITTDVGIVTANGSYATIVRFNPLAQTGAVCTHPETSFRDGEFVIFRSEASLDSMSAVLRPTGVTACASDNGHGCANDCQNFDYVPNGVFRSDPGAINRGYLGGEVAGKLKTIVWFMVGDGVTAQLRRAVFDDENTCVGRNDLCGSNVVSNVEALLAQAWVFDRTSGLWDQRWAGSDCNRRPNPCRRRAGYSQQEVVGAAHNARSCQSTSRPE